MSRSTCDYCGLTFSGPGYSPGGKSHYCCYGCYLVERIIGSAGQEGIAAWIVMRMGVGAFLAMNVMMISLVLYTQSPQALGPDNIRGLRWGLAVLATPAVIILAGPFILGSIKDLLRRRITMDCLIATGCVAAYAVSIMHVAQNHGHIYFDTATMLPLVITIGRLIEATAKLKTTQAIKEVLDLLPQQASILRDGVEIRIPTARIAQDDLILIRPGERIPSDGVIIEGSCLVEEAAYTGEPLPRPCAQGDHVHGGSIDLDGPITIRATSTAESSLLARIARMVHSAQQEKAPVERLAEKVASAFVPIVWIAAALTFAYWGWARHDMEKAAMSAMAVLVVACPCALGIATPMAVCIALGKSAAAGVLIRSGEVLERLPRITQIFFDKTGTLTDTHLTVSEIITSDGLTTNEALAWAASLAACSEHIASRAIVSEAHLRGINPGQVTEFHIHPGLGISGRVTIKGDSRLVTLGSLRLLSQAHQPGPDSSAPLTTTYAGWDGQVHAAISLKDTIRPDARPMVNDLIAAGIEPAIISGDRNEPVANLSSQLGMHRYHSECTPEDKVEIIKTAGKTSNEIAMVGDGINDAPALAAANISIAIGSGTDLARDSSDIALLGNDLSRIPWAIELSRRTYSTIRHNLIWAFAYNLAAIILACLGYVHPLIAAAAMVISSISVVANSLKLLRE